MEISTFSPQAVSIAVARTTAIIILVIFIFVLLSFLLGRSTGEGHELRSLVYSHNVNATAVSRLKINGIDLSTNDDTVVGDEDNVVGVADGLNTCNKTLFLADKPEYRNVGLRWARLRFTTESPEECVAVFRRYLEQGDYMPQDYTRGLFYRGVE